jgi:hypothetical protein
LRRIGGQSRRVTRVTFDSVTTLVPGGEVDQVRGDVDSDHMAGWADHCGHAVAQKARPAANVDDALSTLQI